MLALIAAPGALSEEKPDFSGTWKLDLQLTRFNDVEPPKSLIMKIDHQEPRIKIRSETETKAGVVTESIELPTDGSEHQCKIDGQTALASANWDQWTGERLVWIVKRETPQGSMEVTRRAKLGDKGKILTTVATIKTSGGEQKYNEFFVRQ
jgi:hypothetical protein